MQHQGEQVALMLGRLLERSEQVADHVEAAREWMQRVDVRLAHGDEIMRGLGERLKTLEAKPPPAADQVSALERWIKDGLRYLVPIGVLWVTGSIEKALELLQAAGKLGLLK